MKVAGLLCSARRRRDHLPSSRMPNSAPLGLSLLSGGGCSLGVGQGDFLFVALFGAASVVAITETIRRPQPPCMRHIQLTALGLIPSAGQLRTTLPKAFQATLRLSPRHAHRHLIAAQERNREGRVVKQSVGLLRQRQPWLASVWRRLEF